VLVLSGCGSGGEPGSDEQIVAAFYPLAYAAARLAPGAQVTNLTQAGAEPHDLELTAGDAARVHDADLVIYFGDGFMPQLEDAVAGQQNAVDLLAGEQLHPGDHEGEAVDPHIWLDPARYVAVVRKIADALDEPKAADPLVDDLEALDTEFREGLSNCERHQIVTSHAAFGYLAAAYGLQQVAITGISPEAEPTPRELEATVDQVKRTGATTVFFETLVSPRLAETVARETGASTAVLDPIEGLTADAAGDGADYFTVMRDNLKALRSALGCR
jgi:zinc transport system substrate-binding protein